MKKLIFGGLVVLSAISFFNVAGVSNASATDLSQLIQAAQAQDESSSQGTLYGNAAGTRFCCGSGSRSCGAASC